MQAIYFHDTTKFNTVDVMRNTLAHFFIISVCDLSDTLHLFETQFKL